MLLLKGTRTLPQPAAKTTDINPKHNWKDVDSPDTFRLNRNWTKISRVTLKFDCDLE